MSSEKRSNTVDEEKVEENGGASLPEEQVLEVLTRVPLDDLAACRVVSTRWNSITYEPAFAQLHCRRTPTISGYFLQGTVSRNNCYRADFISMHASSPAPAISLDFLPCTHVRLEAVAAHRGLACCVGRDNLERPCYYVCKPATRQWRALPNPRVRFHTAAMAMEARPSCSNAKAEFKIVRFSISKFYKYLRCEVFDSRRFAWHRAPDVPLCPVSLTPFTPAVRAHGAMHWFRWAQQDVFAFDIESEEWWLIALPREVERDPYWARKQLSAVAGKLCLLVVTTTEPGGDEELMEVWEMANYAEGRWEKKMTVSLKSLLAQEGFMELRDLYNSDLAFLYGFRDKAIWYDLRRGKKGAQVKVDPMSVQEVFKFESDMIPCQIGNAKRVIP